MDNKKIAERLDAWWHDDKTCSGEEVGCNVNCDLCTTCLMNLCERLGCVWNVESPNKVTVRGEKKG